MKKLKKILLALLLLISNISFSQKVVTLEEFITEWKGAPYRLGGY